MTFKFSLIRKPMTLAASLFLASLIPANAQADSEDLKTNLPKLVAAGFEKLDLKNGASIAVVQGDTIVFAEGFGYADIENRLQASAETSFYIASSTKSFTGLAAELLALKGIIDLDKGLSAYFPEIEFDAALGAEKITIRHLLSHTHGIDNDPLAYTAAYTGSGSLDRQLALLEHSKVNEKAPFGTYKYTNLGYNIFSIIIERELNKPWQKVLAEEIFAPLKMRHTSSYMSDAEKGNWPLAKPYLAVGQDREKALYLTKQDNTMHAAGGMISSASDMANFLKAQLNKGKLGGEQIFPAVAINNAHQILINYEQNRGPYQQRGYSMGWTTSNFYGQKLLHHFGGFAGASSHMSFMPEHGLGVIILMNENIAANRFATVLAHYIYDEMQGIENAYAEGLTDLDTLAQGFNDFKARVNADIANRVNRKSQLTLPLEAYIGSYSSPLYGKMDISIETAAKALKVSFGNMYAIGTPYKNPDTIRLELVPGSGRGLQFMVTNGAVTGLQYDGIELTRD